MPDLSDEVPASSRIDPEIIRIEPPVKERYLDPELIATLDLPPTLAGVYLPPDHLSNPDRGSHLIGIQSEESASPEAGREYIDGRLLRIAWSLFEEAYYAEDDIRRLMWTYVSEMQNIYRREELTPAYREAFEEELRAHETTHYYQEVRLGISELFEDAETARLNMPIAVVSSLERQKFRLTIFLEAQCILNGILHTGAEDQQMIRDLVVVGFGTRITVLNNIDYMFKIARAGNLENLKYKFTDHDLATIILATQNPNILDDISAGRLEFAEFKTGLVAFYDQLIKDPEYCGRFVGTIGSKEFQLGIDRQLIGARDELKKGLDEFNDG